MLFLVVLTIGSLKASQGLAENEFFWPIDIPSDNGFVTTLYQPQIESFNENILEGRMAVTIKPPETEMLFGAVWFKAKLHTDIDNRTVLLEKIQIPKIHFPDMEDEEKLNRFSGLLSQEIESLDLVMSLDRILASIDEVEDLKQLSDQIRNDPPKIYLRTTPAVLLMIDGDPIFKKDEDSNLEYLVNSAFFIVRNPNKEEYYINGGPFWYKSEELLSGWEETTKVPSDIRKFAEKSIEGEVPDSIRESLNEAPELIIETRAAELIILDGEIDYKTIAGTGLLYVSNTESDILMDINSQNHYILIAGRWYYSKSLKDGDWQFCEPSELPGEFIKIPEESEMASVRPSIPGTEEAQTALLEQSIPQTATVDRKEATVEVSYDGAPEFEPIEGTEIVYALNTDKTVLMINDIYYCVDDAIWFRSSKATGPWEVCVERPSEIDQIPPEAPVYNVKYVYIYESTPEVVYVGYLPGYTHCYVYGGVVVYGTGYYYKPWYYHNYYPRPVTWGYGVHYNPYTGWGFSVGVSYGWVSWRFHPYRGGYWGPRGYHRGYRHGYHRGYKAGYAAGKYHSNRNVYSQRSSGVKQSRNNRNVTGANNINNRSRSSGKANNMYADKNGNVYQRNRNGDYEKKSNRGQTPSPQNPSTNQRQPQQGQIHGSQKQQMDRYHQNRTQGTQNYQRSQQYNRGGSARQGGGGGRRR